MRVSVVLLDVLDVVVEVAPVVARTELVMSFHVKELVRLLKVPLRRPWTRRGEGVQGRRGPEQRPLLSSLRLKAASEVTLAHAAEAAVVEEVFVSVLLRVEIG